MSCLLLLSPKNKENNKTSKILNKKLEKIKDFDLGYLFYFETIDYENIHHAMKNVFKKKDFFLTLGELNDLGNEYKDSGEPGPRRKKKGDPTLQDKDGIEIILDLDDHIIEKYNAFDPEISIKKWLKDKKINCDVTWQITSSQQLNTEQARLRLYFQLDKPAPMMTRKAYAQNPNIQADGCIYSAQQPIYTAPPTIEGGVDPIKNRTGFIKGNNRLFKLPPFKKEEIKEYSSHFRGYENHDFNENTLPDEVLNGSVYRRYFMPLAFHYVNKLNQDRDGVFAIISFKSSQVKGREFDAENVYQYIDDAISRLQEEKYELGSNLLRREDIEEIQDAPLPIFPSGIMETWPAPWPMIWENFKKMPRELEEALLIPTILSLNSFFLQSAFVTSRNRRPNLFFLNLTPSTGNKDVNSKKRDKRFRRSV